MAKIAEARCTGHGTYSSQYLQELYVVVNSTNIENNTSNVTITYTNKNTQTSDANYGWANPAIIYLSDANGQRSQSFANSSTDYRNWATVTLGTWTTDVKHNADGTLTLYISAGFSSESSSLSGGNLNGFIILNQIPREAKIITASNFNDEQNPTITFTNPGGFRINARLEFGGTSIQRNNIPNTGTYTFQLTEEERNLLRSKCPNSNTLTVRQVIATYLNSETENRWNYQDKTMTIINANPVFSDFDSFDINPTTVALTNNTHSNVNGYSTIRVYIAPNVKATAQKGASMVKYQLVIGNKSVDIAYSDSDLETVYGEIANSPIGVYNLYAVDSRGNSTLVTKLAQNTIEYEDISFISSDCKVVRSNGGVGENAVLTLSGTIWNDDFGQVTNSIKHVVCEYKETGQDDTHWLSSPTTITPTVSDNTFNFSAQIGSQDTGGVFDLQKSYNFRITITDELSTSLINLIPMASGIPNLSLSDNGVGIMCDYDETKGGELQIGGEVYGGVQTFSETLTDAHSSNTGIKITTLWKKVDKVVTLMLKVYMPANKGGLITVVRYPFTIPDWAKPSSDSNFLPYTDNSRKLLGRFFERNEINSSGDNVKVAADLITNDTYGLVLYGSCNNGDTSSAHTMFGTITYILD